ncbi:MAG: hypothetical protein F6K42_16755 [Leptolyngbya sp. SIO1D8]|nr:hypothetical protein [Leptolyngbya sp. SIO1D8]
MTPPTKFMPIKFKARPSATQKVLQRIRAQLRHVGLSVESIEKQDTESLENSLKRVEELLNYPDSLTLLRIQYSRYLGYYFSQDGVLISFDTVIRPILQNRKTLITGRLEALSLGNGIQSLRESIGDVDNISLADQLRGLKEHSQSLEGQLIESSKEQDHLSIQMERERLALFEGRFKLFLLLLEKDLAASLIGTLFIIIAPVMMMIHGGDIPVLKQCLFLVFGYFFGQATHHSSHPHG